MKSVFNFSLMIIFCIVIYFVYFLTYKGIDESIIKIHLIDNTIFKLLLYVALAYIGGVIVLNIVLGALLAGMFNVFITKLQRLIYVILVSILTVVQWLRFSLEFYSNYHGKYQWYEEFVYILLVYFIFKTVYQTARFQYNIEEAELLFKELKYKLDRNEITKEQASRILHSDKRLNHNQKIYIVELLNGNKHLTLNTNTK